MENREVKIGQAVQCKKTDWFKKIYGDMIDDKELKSITLPDGTRFESDPVWLDSFLSDIHITAQPNISSTRRTARLTSMENELMERIFVSGNSSEATDVF